MKFKACLPLLIAALPALIGTVLRLAGVPLSPPLMALIGGAAILGASFLLLWACDAAQSDISQALALAVVALMAVLPEYAVDMYFTWEAGQFPDSNYSHYAIANMTGANRLLIGVAWGTIALLYWIRRRRPVEVEEDRRMELAFLGLATAYAFVIPIKGSLAWYDGLVFLGMYVWYIAKASRRPCVENEAFGPAEFIIRMPKGRRRIVTALLFLVAGGAILANAEPFSEGLVQTGKIIHINEFLLVQWLAPIASEAPEFVVAAVFTWRGQASMALGSLLSSKLNQWTLLVGMIPGVFAVSHGSLDHPLPMGSFQMNEILLTAAQSLFAVFLLSSLRLSIAGAIVLFVLFAGQLVLPGENIRLIFSAIYIAAAVLLLLWRPRMVWNLRKGLTISSPPAS